MNVIPFPQKPIPEIADDVDIFDCLIDDEVTIETFLNTIPVSKAKVLYGSYAPGSVQTDKLSPELRRCLFIKLLGK